MAQDEFHAGDTAPVSGPYLELNIFGSPTGMMIEMQEAETFPVLPHGFAWKPLSAYSAQELRERAAYYRQMAGTASTQAVRDELLKLSRRFDELADRRDGGL